MNGTGGGIGAGMGFRGYRYGGLAVWSGIDLSASNCLLVFKGDEALRMREGVAFGPWWYDVCDGLSWIMLMAISELRYLVRYLCQSMRQSATEVQSMIASDKAF